AVRVGRLGPADEPVVGGDLDEDPGPPARIAGEGLDACHSHRGDTLEPDPDLAVGDAHVELPQPDVAERDATPARHVELERVPRTRHDLSLPQPGELPARVRAEVDRAGDAALAQRPALVRTEVRDRVVV